MGAALPTIRRWLPRVLALVLFVALNALFVLAPIPYDRLGSFAYLGAFLVTFVATAAVFVAVPYIPIVAQIAATVEMPALVVLLAGVGSVAGETVAYVAGRSGRALLPEHPLVRRLEHLLSRPRLTAVFVFALAAVPNPVFDVAGVACGAFGVPYARFAVPVFLGRLVRFAVIAFVGIRLAA